MKTLKLKNILFGLTAILAIAFTMTSCQQDSIISPIEIQDTETTLRTTPTVDDFYLSPQATRIYLYAYNFSGITHRFRYRVQGTQSWTWLDPTTKYHDVIPNAIPCTTYEVQLRVLCPGGWGGWSPTETGTSQGCNNNGDCVVNPNFNFTFEDYTSTLYLYAFEYQGVNHRFRYTVNNITTELDETTSHYNAITDKECDVYTIELSIECGNGNWSQWEQVGTITPNAGC